MSNLLRNKHIQLSRCYLTVNSPNLNTGKGFNFNYLNFAARNLPILPAITNLKLLTKVLTKNSEETNKQLAFLGDAYLDFLVSIILFERTPNLNIMKRMFPLIVQNKNYSLWSTKYQLLEKSFHPCANPISPFAKANADLFEAYFGALALENFININPPSRSIDINQVYFEFANSKVVILNLCREIFESHPLTNKECSLSDQFERNEHHGTHYINELIDTEILYLISQNNATNKRYQWIGDKVLKFLLTRYLIENFPLMKVSILDRMRCNMLTDNEHINTFEKVFQFNSIFKGTELCSRGKRIHLVKKYLGVIACASFVSGSSKSEFKLGYLITNKIIENGYANTLVKAKNREE